MSFSKILTEQTTGQEVEVSTPAWLALAKKAGKNDVPLSVLEQVYARGVVTAEPHPKNTPEQQAFHRVESFIHEGKAYELDSDLTEMCPVPDGSKHMDVIKNAIKNHKERIKSQQQVNEVGLMSLVPLPVALAAKGVGAIIRKKRSGYWTKKGEQSSPEYRAKQIFKSKEASHLANQMFQKKYGGGETKDTESGPRRTMVNLAARKGLAAGIGAAKTEKLITRFVQSKASQETKRQQKQETPNQDVTPSGQKFTYSNKGEASKGWNASRSRAEKSGFNSTRRKLAKAVKSGGGGRGIG